MLQTARYLLKSFQRAAMSQKISPFVEYLANPFETLAERSIITNINDLLDLEHLRRILKFNAVYAISVAAQKLQEGNAKGIHDKENWDNHAGVALVEAAFAHFYLWNFSNSMEVVFNTKNESVKKILNKLTTFYGICKIAERPIGLFESGYFAAEQFKHLREARERLLADLRPEAAALTEVFFHHDNTLKTAIGLKGGNAYENLFDWVQNKNNVNKPGVHQTMRKTILEGLKAKL
jgi:acyl-CoA oxidase